MNDSIDSIVEDCSLPPSVYMQRFHEDMDEAEMTERMCRDLIGRTIAQMGRDGNIGRAYSRRTGKWFHQGDRVRHVDHARPWFHGVDAVGTVIGTALLVEVEVKCLVVEYDDGSVDVIAVDYAEKVEEPTVDDIHEALDSDMPAERLLKLVDAYVKARGAR